MLGPPESVMEIDSPSAIELLLQLCDCKSPILDTTYGNGTFWKGSKRLVIGCDKNPSRSKDFTCDFRSLPFQNNSYPTVVFDPPFHPFVKSAEEPRFSGMGKNKRELKRQFMQGVSECWRVTSRHLIIKCQSYVHDHSPLWMPLWAIEVCGEPFEWLVATRKNKRISGRWKTVRSLRRKCADYVVFDKRGNYR